MADAPRLPCSFVRGNHGATTNAFRPAQRWPLTAIEDRLAIYTLNESHPPGTDTAFANYMRSVYLNDGMFARGQALEPWSGEAPGGSFAHWVGDFRLNRRRVKAWMTAAP